MIEPPAFSSENVYANAVTGATLNPVITDPDAVDEEFIAAANAVLQQGVELIRYLVGAHQGAAAIVVQNDWQSIRKFFSLSGKYQEWKDYKTPAVGYGIHGWLLSHNQTIRMTQAELETHPEWKNFGTEKGKHPPMRGWMAAPIKDSQGVNWGLLQLSDKYEGEFTPEDEAQFTAFAGLVSTTLGALWEVRNLKKGTTPA